MFLTWDELRLNLDKVTITDDSGKPYHVKPVVQRTLNAHLESGEIVPLYEIIRLDRGSVNDAAHLEDCINAVIASLDKHELLRTDR